MELYIEYAIVFALGWYIGSKITGFIQLKTFKMILMELNVSQSDLIRVARKDAPQFIQEQLDQIEAQSQTAELDPEGREKIEIKVEKHNDTLYAFRKDNDQFLGQGSSREQLIEAMADRMRNVRLIVVEGDEHMKVEA